MNNTNPYMLALLSIEGKFSCLKCVENIKSLPKGGQLIIDDTSLSKMYAKSIEGIRYVYCSTLKAIL